MQVQLVTRVLVPLKSQGCATLSQGIRVLWQTLKVLRNNQVHATGKEATFQLSHWAEDHVDDYVQNIAANTIPNSVSLLNHFIAQKGFFGYPFYRP